MTKRFPSQEGNSRTSVLYEAVRFVTVFGTLFILIALGAFLVIRASRGGFSPGIRSFASVLLPIIVGSFLFMFQRELVEGLRAVRTGYAFGVAMALGLLIMVTLRFLERLSEIPIPELLVSACFSVLVFSSGSLNVLASSGGREESDRPLSYYYGVVSGLLVYIILFGFPVIGE